MVSEIAELFSNARTEHQLRRALDHMSSRIGADSYAATRFVSTDHGDCVAAVHSFSDGYLGTFAGDEFPNELDPVMQHLRASSIPIAWDRDTYLAAGVGASYVPMADFGVRSGIALALHIEPRRHFALGFSWSSGALPVVPADMLQTIAVFAEPAFHRVLTRWDGACEIDAGLTLRELEVLFWLGEGDTDKSLAVRLGIAWKTVSWYTQQAARKLGAHTRTEAVAKATRLGLLEPFHLRHGRGNSAGALAIHDRRGSRSR
jgi:DNA-binding CsgD family transcriptional regulator